MAFFGPGVTFDPKPRWKQGWWWREKLPRIAAWVGFVALVVTVVWVVFAVTEPDDSGGGQVPEQTAGPSWSATPATPDRPRENPPERPAAISEPTVEGIEATVRYENDLINYAQRSGDVEPLKKLYDLENCAVCAGLLAGVERFTDNGRYLEGASYTVVSVADIGLRRNAEGEWRGTVKASIQRDAGRQLEADGRFIQDVEADPVSVFNVQLSFDNGAWRIYAT